MSNPDTQYCGLFGGTLLCPAAFLRSCFFDFFNYWCLIKTQVKTSLNQFFKGVVPFLRHLEAMWDCLAVGGAKGCGSENEGLAWSCAIQPAWNVQSCVKPTCAKLYGFAPTCYDLSICLVSQFDPLECTSPATWPMSIVRKKQWLFRNASRY